MTVVIEDKFDEFIKKVDAAAETSLSWTVEVLAQKMRESMPGAGAAVVSGTGGDTGIRAKYISSNPGSPPGVRFNRLLGSITTAKVAKLKHAAGTNVSYARSLEFGTSKMPARPFMRPALNNNLPELARTFNAKMKENLGGAT